MNLPVRPSAIREIVTEPVAAALTATLTRTHGAVLRPFEPLIVRLGRKAVPNVVAVERALATGTATASELDEAWKALAALERGLGSLSADERLRVGYEILVRRQALNALDKDFTAAFSSSATEGINALRSEAAAKAAASAATNVEEVTAGAVITQLRRQLALRQADPALVKLWAEFQLVVPANSPFMIKAATLAAKRVQPIWKIMKTEGVAAGRSHLLGHLVNIRSPLGEGYALGNAVVRADLQGELRLGQEVATRLGPGHQAILVTQVENELRYSGGGEAPDAMVLILDLNGGRAYTKAGLQVKVADTSEAVEQTINDIFREAGIERRGTYAEARLEIKLPGQKAPQQFLLTTHPRVQRRNIIVNASGSRIPAGDTALLDTLGFVIDERVVPMTVAQQNLLAVSKVEAALNAAQRAGLL